MTASATSSKESEARDHEHADGVTHGLSFAFNQNAALADYVDKDYLFGRYQRREDERIDANQRLKMKMAHKALDIPEDEDVKIDARKRIENHNYPAVDTSAIAAQVIAMLPKPAEAVPAKGMGWKCAVAGLLGTAGLSTAATLFAMNLLNKPAAEPTGSSVVTERIEKAQIKFYDDKGNEIHIDRLPESLRKTP